MPEDSTGAPEGAPETDPTPAASTPAPEPAPAQEPDWKTEIERLTREARKWEDRAKTNSSAAKELETLRQQSMTDQERAVAEARAAGITETTMRFAGQLVDAEIRVATTGRLDDNQLSMLLKGLDRSVFLLEDGAVDVKSVRTWIDGFVPKFAPQEQEQEPPQSPQFPDLGQGVRGVAPAQSASDFERALRSVVGAPPR